MKTKSIDSVKERIRLLLNVAKNDAASEGEIKNAWAFVKKLMMQHHIDEEDIKNLKEPDALKEELRAIKIFLENKTISLWENSLACFVRDLVGGVICYTDHKQRRTNKNGIVKLDEKGNPILGQPIVFVGTYEDTDLARQIFKELYVLTASMARLRTGKVFRGEGLSYARGFVEGMRLKLKEIDYTFSREDNSRALTIRSTAIVKRKVETAEEFLKNKMGIILTEGKTKTQTKFSFDDWNAGKNDGKKVNVAELQRKKLTNGN